MLEASSDAVLDVLHDVGENALLDLVENVVALLKSRVAFDVNEPRLEMRVQHELECENLEGAVYEALYLELVEQRE